ncbi:MAG: ABC transporter ATP-binding protein [Clostridia bacterium]|nr:ABC transporter ATP-binding protein [Clostridia bacterium]
MHNKETEKKQSVRSIFSNVVYFIRLMFSLSPVLVVTDLIRGVVAQLPPKLISVLGMKRVIDIVESGEHLERIWSAVAVIAVVLVLSHVLEALYLEFYWRMANEKLTMNLSKKLYEKARSLDLSQYDDPEYYNSFILTIETSADNIQNLLNLVRNYVSSLISFFTIGTVLATIDPLCLLIILAVVLTFLPLSRKVGALQMGRRKDNAALHRRSDYFQRIFYLQEYTKEVRMHGIRPLLIDRYNDAAKAVVDNQRKYWKKIAFFGGVQDFGIQTLGFLFLLPLYLGYCVLVKKSLSAGDFVASFNGAYQIAMSVNFLTVWALSVFSERGKMIEKYREFLATEPKLKDGDDTAPCAAPETIEIKDLSFTYPGNDEPTLRDINLTIRPYEKIALVGYNGAGKTTLTNLLLRLYDPTEGSITIGGQDIRDVTRPSHIDRFAAVFQDFQTYACTIGENVALDKDPDADRVLQSLDKTTFRKPLPDGVDTELLREFSDSGVMLSGGESQKMAVARAFYKNCPYAILDEPSANLDPIAEYELNRAMLEASSHKTVIFISHRLSTTVGADRIYVMENGRIVESGTHKELMERNGTYAYMFRLQAKKYAEGADDWAEEDAKEDA